MGAVFGILNAIIKPIFQLVTIPLVLLTLGLFLIVINACMLLLTSWLAGLFGLGWNVDGFWTALFGRDHRLDRELPAERLHPRQRGQAACLRRTDAR